MTDYQGLNKQLCSLSEGIDYEITILSNATALIYDTLSDINWCGFYLFKDSALLLGPFQGKPACARIEIGKGVCGTAAKRGETILVKNVHEFPGHIACDSASNSEIVIPLYVQGKLYGELDIDSPKLNRFDEYDKEGLELLVSSLAKNLEKIIKAN